MVLAAVLLGLAALGGAFLLRLRMRGGNPPLPFTIVHGGVAGAGYATLAITVVTGGLSGAPVVALAVLGAAALFGFYMLSLHVRGRLVPARVAILHALTALTGYVFLLSHFFA